MNRNIILSCITLAAFSLGSCEDFLDKEPLSLVVPTEYYKDEAQIQAAVNFILRCCLLIQTGVLESLVWIVVRIIRSDLILM